MNTQDTIQQPDIDTQILSDFIYDLNIARRHLSLYPENHPQIAISCETVRTVLSKLCQFRDSVILGIGPEALVFEQHWLDEDNPIYRDFARYLSRFDIAMIEFNKKLNDEELIRFIQTLKQSEKSADQSLSIPDQFKQQGIANISVALSDYSHFQQSSDHRDSSGKSSLWNDFLMGLMQNTLDKDGEALDSIDLADMEAVAQFLNQSDINLKSEKIDYEDLISRFISRLKSQEQQQLEETGEHLSTLVNNLNPELKRNFLNSTLNAIDSGTEPPEATLSALPRQVVEEALFQQNQTQTNVSSRLMDLLGQFSSTSVSEHQHTTGEASPLPEEIQQARVDVLLLEDNHDEYIPDTYQQTLGGILTGQVSGAIDEKSAQRLRKRLEKQSVEQQCSAIIFNILNGSADAESEQLMQSNLTELSRFFLDTGDFIALKDIFQRWSEHLYSGNANTRFLEEKVLAIQTSEAFMNDVLDSVALWGKDKYDAICHYIVEVGEPYAELLITRLAYDEDMVRRKNWMKLLVELGSKGHQIILKTLEDDRWYLVRNLLIVLGQQRDAAPMKAVQHLTGHSHPKVRQEAIRILFRHNPPTANRILLKELSSGHWETLCSAVQLAENSRDPKVIAQLHHLLNGDLNHDRDLTLKKLILDTLAFLGLPESIPVLAKLLNRKGLIQSRRVKDFQLEIISKLGAFPAHASEPLLKSIVSSRNRAQSQAAQKQLAFQKDA